jgi:ribosomal protein L14E/L6E/L27E
MEWKRGQVVRSLAGHDKGSFLAVLEIAPPCVVVADGKRRPLERPKRKNLFHLAPTGTVLPEEALKTNRAIRGALAPFARAAEK